MWRLLLLLVVVVAAAPHRYPMDASRVRDRGDYSIHLNILDIMTAQTVASDWRLSLNPSSVTVRGDLMRRAMAAFVGPAELTTGRGHDIGYLAMRLDIFGENNPSNSNDTLMRSVTPWLISFRQPWPSSQSSWSAVLAIMQETLPVQTINGERDQLFQLDHAHSIGLVFNSEQTRGDDDAFLDLSDDSALWTSGRVAGYAITRNTFQFIGRDQFTSFIQEWAPPTQRRSTDWNRSLYIHMTLVRQSGHRRLCQTEQRTDVYVTAHDTILQPKYHPWRLCLDFDGQRVIVPQALLYHSETLESVEGIGIELDGKGRPFILPRERLIEGTDDRLIVLGRSEIAQWVEMIIYERESQQYRVALSGAKPRRVESIVYDRSGLHSAMVPEIDGWRGLFIIIVATMMLVRTFAAAYELALAAADSAVGPPRSYDPRIGPPNMSALAIDPFLYIFLAISLIWYFSAVAMGAIPIVPSYLTFWLWTILGIVVAALGPLFLIFYGRQVYRHAPPGFDWFSDIFSRTILGALLLHWPGRIRRGLISLPLLIAVRGVGYAAGFIALLFALWWDTDDPFHWGFVATLVFLLAIYMAYHWMEWVIYLSLAAKSPIMNHPGTVAYFMIWTIATALAAIFGLPQVVIPFLQSVGSPTYSDTVIVYGTWNVYVFSFGLSAGILAWDMITARTLIRQAQK